MIALGWAVQVKGLGLALVSARYRLTAARRSTMPLKTPRLRRWRIYGNSPWHPKISCDCRHQPKRGLRSDRSTLLYSRRLHSVEPPVTLFDAASPLVPGNRGANMVRTSAFACSGDFLLRLAGCQSKDLIA